jgi:enoyl-CoA hydratase/carnithine racemase
VTTVEISNEAVLLERRGNIAYIRMNRPEVGNAVVPATMRLLCQKLDEAIEDPSVRVLILGHNGKHFLAGADFTFLQDLTQSTTHKAHEEIYRWFQGASRRLHLCTKPTIAAVGGAAITVGCELAVACDFRVVTPEAVFQQSWMRMGLIPPLGGLKVLPALVGYGLAKEMVLRMRPVKGEEAVRTGLASELVSDLTQLEERALSIAQELAALPPLAYAAAKEGLRRGLESSFDEGWSHSLLAQAQLIGSQDFQEGVAAAAQRRTPTFSGR